MPERRRLPRTTLKHVACILIEQDKVGVVVNLSGEGLCFQSLSPIEQEEVSQFALLQQTQFIDINAELAWLDATHTSGGLRFSTLSPEARGQIDEWAKYPPASSEDQDKSTTPEAETVAVCAPEPASTPVGVSKQAYNGCTARSSATSGLRTLCNWLKIRKARPNSRRPPRVAGFRAFNPSQMALAKLPRRSAPDSVLSRHTWRWLWTAVRRYFGQKWIEMLDPIRIVAIGAEINEIFEKRYRASLKHANGEQERRIWAEFLQDQEALEQERLTILSRRTVRAAEKYNIDIPSSKFIYNHRTDTLILPRDERRRVQRQVMQECRFRLASRILWLAPVLVAIIALTSVWLAEMLKGVH